jgi:hypothetical protein
MIRSSLVVLAGIVLAAGACRTTTQTATATTTTRAAPATVITEDGTYRVGVDIQPGTWTTPAPENDTNCGWSRIARTGKVVASNQSRYAQTVIVYPWDYELTVTGCKGWTRQ